MNGTRGLSCLTEKNGTVSGPDGKVIMEPFAFSDWFKSAQTSGLGQERPQCCLWPRPDDDDGAYTNGVD